MYSPALLTGLGKILFLWVSRQVAQLATPCQEPKIKNFALILHAAVTPIPTGSLTPGSCEPSRPTSLAIRGKRSSRSSRRSKRCRRKQHCRRTVQPKEDKDTENGIPGEWEMFSHEPLTPRLHRSSQAPVKMVHLKNGSSIHWVCRMVHILGLTKTLS